MPVFLEDLVDPFYEPVGNHFRNLFVRGQFHWIHISYTQQNIQLWRPVALDVSGTSAAAFEIVPPGPDVFRRRTPLHTPKLETNEEFLVTRAKVRPVILMSPSTPVRQAQAIPGGGRVHRPLAIVIPVFSLADRFTGNTKYDSDFIERMRLLEFPEFIYLPPHAGVLPVPSYARVGEAQAVYEAHLEPRNLKLRDEALKILQGQLRFLVSQTYAGPFAAYREQLLHQEAG